MSYSDSHSEDLKRAQRTILQDGIVQFPKRLEKVVEEVGSVRMYASRAGLSEGVIRKYLKGDSFPTIDKAVLMALAGAVNVLWLVTGEGAMRLHQEAGGGAHDPEMSEFALIPGYNIQVSAGSGALPSDETPTRKLAFRHKWLKYKGLKEKDLALVFADGDSMEPTISDNNTLMIDTSQKELKDGHIYVIRTNSHLIVKRVQTLWNKGILLLSDNKEYKEQQVEPNEADDLEVIGRVVWIGKDV
ncbi:MAG: LexA family transcriptional regulator [Neptuniibacter sp.]